MFHHALQACPKGLCVPAPGPDLSVERHQQCTENLAALEPNIKVFQARLRVTCAQAEREVQQAAGKAAQAHQQWRQGPTSSKLQDQLVAEWDMMNSRLTFLQQMQAIHTACVE